MRVALEAEAQRDDKGRKMMTRVRTLEDISGMVLKYWMMEKMARRGLAKGLGLANGEEGGELAYLESPRFGSP